MAHAAYPLFFGSLSPSSRTAHLGPLFNAMRAVLFRLLCPSCSSLSAFAEGGAGDVEISGSIPRVTRVETETISQRSPPRLLDQIILSDDPKFLPRTASTARAQQTSDGSLDAEHDRNKEDSESPVFVKRKRGVGLPVSDGVDDESPRWERLGISVESRPWCGPGGLLTFWRVRWILVLQCIIAVRTGGRFSERRTTQVCDICTLPPAQGAAEGWWHVFGLGNNAVRDGQVRVSISNCGRSS